MGAIELRGGGRAAVSPPAASAIPGDRGDQAGPGVDSANGMVLGVDDQDVALAVEGHLLGAGEGRGGGGSAVTGESGGAGAGARGDDARLRVDRAEGVPLAFE